MVINLHIGKVKIWKDLGKACSFCYNQLQHTLSINFSIMLGMVKNLQTNHGEIKLPTFFPDGTRAVVKGGVDSLDLEAARVEGLVINTYHL